MTVVVIFYAFDSGIFLHIRICNCDQLADDRPLMTSASCAEHLWEKCLN